MKRNMAGQIHSGKYNTENRKHARVLCASMFFIKIRIYYKEQNSEPRRKGGGKWVEGGQTYLELLPTPSL